MMIRPFTNNDLDAVMALWLASNTDAHHFIESSYWERQFPIVRGQIPKATVYVDSYQHKILGFIGLTGDVIAGLFVAKDSRSNGIGTQLLNTAKSSFQKLSLQVYQKNQRAVQFYLREGFAIVRTQIDEKTGEPEYVMEWKAPPTDQG